MCNANALNLWQRKNMLKEWKYIHITFNRKMLISSKCCEKCRRETTKSYTIDGISWKDYHIGLCWSLGEKNVALFKCTRNNIVWEWERARNGKWRKKKSKTVCWSEIESGSRGSWHSVYSSKSPHTNYCAASVLC